MDNGSIACDLIDIGVLKKNSGEERKKVLLRANGTTVYMTQDLGIGMNRWASKHFSKMIYVVANEQERHFQVLFKLLEAIEPEIKDKTHHLSYGMVNLPSGRMKSREGTVVDADDLLAVCTPLNFKLNCEAIHFQSYFWKLKSFFCLFICLFV